MKTDKRGQWFLFQAGIAREKKAIKLIQQFAKANKLTDDIYELWFPQEETKQPDGKVTIENLYPGFIFVRCDNFDNVQMILKRVSKLNILPGDTPYVKLSREEVQELMKLKFKPTEVKESKFKQSEEVTITHGPFKTFSGRIIEINATKQTVRVAISIFGRDTPVALNFTEVEKVQ